jgi:hypothetical protein
MVIMENEILTVEDIASILHIRPNTIHSKRWKEKTGCPLNKHGKRLLSHAPEFWKWFESQKN